jgi:tripartite-type tricarboxylate transporter receptor subunit TctC
MKKLLYISLFIIFFFNINTFSIARADYPEKPITLIVNYAPGSSSDLAARTLADAAAKILGQPIIVVNKAGASGTLGVGAIASAKPDGYTIGVTSYAPLTMGPHMFDVPYDPIKDFDQILTYGLVMYGPVVRADSQFKTLKDLVQYAKANPGKIKFSAIGAASPNNFGMVHLAKAEGIRWELVVFKGNIECVSAVLGGHVDIVSQTPADVVPYIKAGRLRLLASFCSVRWKWLPEVPTARELGYHFDVESYYALGAPKGTPRDIVDKLKNTFKQGMETPQFLETMERIYVPPYYRSGEDYQKMIETGVKSMGEIIKELGLHKSQKK